MQKQVKLKIIGKVHGVGFRKNAECLAKNLGLTGYVKNLDDGSVEILAEGEEGSLQKFIDWAGVGPYGARVDKLFVMWQQDLESYQDFRRD